jgi:sarcosine oxidase subunit beta
VVEVETTSGPIAAGTVVNAAGAWAGELGAPVTPLPRHIVPAAGRGALADDHPMTIFVEDGFHFRVRDGRALLLLPGPGGDAWLAEVERLTRARVPALDGVRLDRGAAWSGLYEMSPDRHAVLGRVGQNLVLVNGSSGHGVMHAPALGQLAAEIVLDGAAGSLDVRALRPERFAEGDPVVGLDLL